MNMRPIQAMFLPDAQYSLDRFSCPCPRIKLAEDEWTYKSQVYDFATFLEQYFTAFRVPNIARGTFKKPQDKCFSFRPCAGAGIAQTLHNQSTTD